jgi:chaperone required for assembly of F1-ATPase
VAELSKNFHNDDAFRKMDDGKYEVALDGEAVREAARSLLAG